MGIYDRDYVRREGPSFLGSFAERGYVCKRLILLNIAFFVVQILTKPDPSVEGLGWFTEALELNVDRILHGQVWRLLSYAFLHNPYDVWHIVFNMLFLWWFGSDMEDLYGPREFLTFYLTAAFAAGLLFFFSSFAWMPDARLSLGASGAVLAVVVLCVFHYPTRTIYLFFILPVPLWLLLIVFLAHDAFVFLHRSRTTTAVAVHLGGALFAAAYYRYHWRLTDWWPQIRLWRRKLFRPKLRVYREEESRRPLHVPAAVPSAEDEQLEAKMDAILEKISRVGKENLTESEQALLLRASEVYRRRRS